MLKQLNLILSLSIGVACLSVPATARSDNGDSEQESLKLARRHARIMQIRNGGRSVTARKGPNFSGRWAGRLVLTLGNCKSPISSFLFRHIVSQSSKTGAGSIATSHDGTFFGGSRDGGRRFEATRSFTVNGRRFALGLVYKNLAGNGRTTGIGYAVATDNGCRLGFGATGIKQ